jgi:Cu+-exporting ATPase
MTCANCVATVERALRSVPGVLAVSVSLAQENAAVEFIPGEASLTTLRQRVEDAGYELS